MNTISCGYRIYPAWFGGNDQQAIKELARGSADRMGCSVDTIAVTHSGFDRRGGHFLDFTVTYIRDNVTQRSTS